MMQRILPVLLSACMVIGCNPELDDPFFEYPYEEWEQRADQLPLEDVYGLYKQLIEQQPPLGGVTESLGKHGRDAILVWLDDIENTRDVSRIWEFGPIIRSAYTEGQYDLCADEDLFRRAVRAVRNANGYAGDQTATRLVRQSCR